MTKYLYDGPFYSSPTTDKYRENYDKVFGKDKQLRLCDWCGKRGHCHEYCIDHKCPHEDCSQ